jgi:regulator-associated protein of mTOR
MNNFHLVQTFRQTCLTSPIGMALRYFVMSHDLSYDISNDMLIQLPGDLKDRRIPWGELNWIFTAITDTITWTTFSRATFTRFRPTHCFALPEFPSR